MSRMMAYEHLLRQILPQTLPCPRSMALDALQMIAMEFFGESGVWVENIEEMASCCDRRITPAVPRNAVLAGVYGLEMDGRKLGRDEYRIESGDIVLSFTLCCACCLYGRMTLRPKRTAMEMPEDLLEEYGDWLIFGALWKLKSMSGNKVEWSDPKGAQFNYELYQEGLLKAKKRKFRKRFGNQLMYVQTAEMEQ